MSPTPSHAAGEPADCRAAVAAERMPPVDAWFHRQQASGAACMTVGYAAWFDGPPPTPAELCGRVRQRLDGFRRLRAVPAADGGNWPHWQESSEPFAVEQHVVAAAADLNSLVSEPLPAECPPWQLHLLPDADGFALLLRAHHALLDGQSLSVLLHALLDTVPAQRRWPESSEPSAARKLAWALDDLLPKARPLPFHGPLGPGRDLAFAQLPSELLAAARSALPSAQASHTAVLLTAVAGALQELGLDGSPSCALVPVDVRSADRATLLGNHYATVRLPLPARSAPHRRLAALERRIRAADLRQRALAQVDLVATRPRRTTVLGTAVGRYVDSPHYFSLLCTSLPSPAGGAATLGAARLTAAALLPPLGPSHPVAVSLTHHPAGAVLTTLTDRPRAALAAPFCAEIADQLRYLAK